MEAGGPTSTLNSGGESMSFEKFEFFVGRNEPLQQTGFLQMKADICEDYSQERRDSPVQGKDSMCMAMSANNMTLSLGDSSTVVEEPAKDSFYNPDGGGNYLDLNDNTKDDLECMNFSDRMPSALPEIAPVLTNLFLSMDNSNNAIDNNICPTVSANLSSATNKVSPNHVFKHPSNELTFNGTLGRLKIFEPLVDAERSVQVRKIDSFESIFAQNEPIDGYDKATEEPAAKSPNDDSKSNAIMSSNSQYPSDYDAFLFNVTSNTPSCVSTTENSVDLNNDTNLNTSRSSTLNASVANFENDSLFCRINENTSDDAYNKPMYSPSLFSDDGEEVSLNESRNIQEIDEAQRFIECDKRFVKRLEKTLQGVPPPPSITTTQLTASEILNLYQTNLPKFNCLNNSMVSDTTLKNGNGVSENVSTSNLDNAKDEKANTSTGENTSSAASPSNKVLNINTNEDCVVKEQWPNLLSLRYYDIYYNYSNYSEEADLLLSRYLLRYIGCETTSSCIAYPLKKSPMKKSLRSNVGKSPGRRLSHLARRKITFCNADNVKNFTTKKQILIDQRRYAGLFGKNPTLRRSPRKRVTPKKTTPLKKTKTPKKKTPGSSQKKRNMRHVSVGKDNIPKTQSTKETSKRALFLSPDNLKSKPVDNMSAVASTSKAIRSKRALFTSPTKTCDISKATAKCESSNDDSKANNRKRKLDDSCDPEFNRSTKIQKSLSFGGDKIETTSQLHYPLSKHVSEHSVNKNEVLSDLQKKKLLWAVAEALRSHSIGVKHEKFRLHLNSLARLTRKISQLPKYARFLRTPGNSTSETLLKIARQHAFLVIRGKSIDEIYTEEQAKQLDQNSTKLTGYIPINGFEKDKQSHLGVKNDENSHDNDNAFKVHSTSASKIVLQDKTIALNIESNNSVDKSSVVDIRNSHSSDSNSKIRACRNLNFETDSCKR